MEEKIKESQWRYERKFIIPNYSVPEVALSLLLHPLNFREIYWQRRVNSLYLDSEGMDFAFENYDGSPEKTKARIRWYGDNVFEIKKPTLEIKAKQGSIGKKVSMDFPEFENINLAGGMLREGLENGGFSRERLEKAGFVREEYQKVVRDSSLPYEYKVKLGLLNPFIITSYERRYFQTFDRRFRATLDFNLSFYQPENMLHFVPCDINQGLVLEIKYETPHEEMAQQVLHRLPFRLGKYSKYMAGLGELWA